MGREHGPTCCTAGAAVGDVDDVLDAVAQQQRRRDRAALAGGADHGDRPRRVESTVETTRGGVQTGCNVCTLECTPAQCTAQELIPLYRGFVIGETGFEPATARPPAGAIQAYPQLFSDREPFELL